MTTKEYFQNITQSFITLRKGARLTFSHFTKSISRKRLRNTTPANDKNYFRDEVGIVTLQYPKEKLPIPEVGRYQLDVEMEDCIVCDKCAKICPVDCIEIESVKAGEQIGTTSDGTPVRLYATKFDIDMAKCCFCGLCTTVCPTECITMTNEYDYSVFDVRQLNFPFSKMTEAEVTLRKTKAEERERKKVEKVLEENVPLVENKNDKAAEIPTPDTEKPTFKPKFKPMMKK
ncbi:MAG: 4Fe-4S dicluster domain-containing protein [Cytophagales bacterium]|nr:MAG: 4Fe-4S dicluster domain-containing protein [Cytophagales bacterium]